MKNLAITVLLTSLLTITGCGLIQSKGQPTSNANAIPAICKADGLFEIKKRSLLKFTFNAQLPDRSVSRSWEWDIQSNTVMMDGEPVDANDGRFINDTYWLFFPLRAHEARAGTQVSVMPNVKSPIDGHNTTEVVVTYVDGKGKTPNDVYKLYCNEQNRVIEWAYHRGGSAEATRTTRWTDYTDFDGIRLSLNRPSSGEFRIWFTDVVLD